ncbi:MAG: DUF5677 domain-containing protein, partial [Planctomycetota bacterium]|nr:DUF5677 domain-containing protein [Planctomycetota bacterium]
MAQKENDVICKVNSDLKGLHDFASQKIIPKLDTKLRQCKPSIKDKAIADTYIRICLSVGSVIKLNESRRDFQALASASRTILELYIDMHLLDKEKINNGFEKFVAFVDAKRFSIAESDRNWSKENKFPFDEMFPERAEYLEEMTIKKMSEKIQQLWKKDKTPDHWSGLHMRDRAAKLGRAFVEKYIRLYYLGNWCVHSGPLDWKA